MSFTSYIALLFGISMLAMPTSAATCKGSATYEITFTNTWTSDRFKNLPRSAHFSPLVAVTHTARFSLYVPLGYATPGVKQVAETGATGIILGELARARSNGFAGSVMVGGGPSPGGKTSVRLVADCKHSRISMISMLAPSPDWFVGLSNVKLVQNGRFIGGESGKLKVMDAGTDSGTMLMSRDKKTIGPENIAPLNSAPFYQKSVADYEIRKIGK